MTPTEFRLKIAKEYVSRVKEAFGEICGRAYVFGSVARNEARDDSDVDIMIFLKIPNKKSDYDYMRSYSEDLQNLAMEFRNNYGIEISPYWINEKIACNSELFKTAITKEIII